ncbi:hypothetical protein B5F74_11725 [Collinsella sp. An271]|uniref:glycosyltransferase family 2 protein n=1 Tax=Collinsella sp. An271 TaxID=1965616 RepID=UPI000B391485|nr:glycosyltransferase [Collinsella sp. An271]OUO57789.1 hypothetical protein B5F74_11725 [Collinsella sp. An271]
MRLSVVVPMRDCYGYVGPLLDNLDMQGLGEEEYEVVAVDDGSADGTAAELSREAASRPNLRVVKLDGRGAGAARNAGTDAARGDFLYFMDADDSLLPGTLARLLSRAEADRLDCLLFGGEPVYATPELERLVPQYRGLLERSWAPEGVVTGRDAIVAQAAIGDFCPCVWLMLLRTGAVRAAGARFPEGIVNEDNAFALRAVLGAGRLAVDPGSFYRYSVREGSVTSSNRSGEARWLAHLELLAIFEGEARAAWADGDTELAAAVRELSSWFAEVCVRDCPDDPLRVLAGRPEAAPLSPAARLAGTAACERARAEVAEDHSRALEAELAGREAPGVRQSMALLREALARRFGHGGTR